MAATCNNAIPAATEASLAVRRGEVVALLGADGGGKATTLQSISGLLPARCDQVAGGRIIFDGCDLVHASPAKLVRSGAFPCLKVVVEHFPSLEAAQQRAGPLDPGS
ncbi:ATP-binding cassette domain-containing protein [Bradyrhizobium sp. BR 1432]|uniref:ATP-binding cassette domain-containing protein n=1 Tax=Bradyrhizobium sp. BR 1432 TaxID=3447966 RepID=UPI003EE5BF2D